MHTFPTTTINIITHYLQPQELIPFFLTHFIPFTTPFTHTTPLPSPSILPPILHIFPSIILTHITINSSQTLNSYLAHIPPSVYKYIKTITYEDNKSHNHTNTDANPLKQCINLTKAEIPIPHMIKHNNYIKHLHLFKSLIPSPPQQHLHHLTIQNKAIPSNLSDLSIHYPHIKSLHITNHSYYAYYHTININNFYLPRLHTLKIIYNNVFEGTPIPSSHLTHLKISYHNMHIIPSYPSITSLHLFCQNLSLIPSKLILHNLKRIKLSYCSNINSEILHQLSPNIQSIILNNTNINFELNFKKLKKIYTIHSSFSQSTITKCHNLTHLIITQQTYITHIQSKSLKHITIYDAISPQHIHINAPIETINLINVKGLRTINYSGLSHHYHQYIHNDRKIILKLCIK